MSRYPFPVFSMRRKTGSEQAAGQTRRPCIRAGQHSRPAPNHALLALPCRARRERFIAEGRRCASTAKWQSLKEDS